MPAGTNVPTGGVVSRHNTRRRLMYRCHSCCIDRYCQGPMSSISETFAVWYTPLRARHRESNTATLGLPLQPYRRSRCPRYRTARDCVRNGVRRPGPFFALRSALVRRKALGAHAAPGSFAAVVLTRLRCGHWGADHHQTAVRVVNIRSSLSPRLMRDVLYQLRAGPDRAIEGTRNIVHLECDLEDRRRGIRSARVLSQLPHQLQ